MRCWGWTVAVVIAAIGASTVEAADAAAAVEIDGIQFQVAPGWTLQRVAAEPLVRYPIHADLAPDGRLFVLESSGSSAPVKQQLEERPHRLIVLEDTDGDGHYDRRQVFAEGLMLPQGVLWTPEGVLVAAPPEIWQFRDTDGDGRADERSVWFDGKTLTGCANDLHGPFAGPDGWIYWCKGAFAEQTYTRADGTTWSTRASHIFRRHPRTGIVESVMAGGMDNPVEFAMNLSGERFFTCTFIQHPADGRRDALVHAIEGGVYGKEQGALDGHPRTGPLMPVMTHLGPAAPAGLMIRQATLGDENLRGELAVAQFNLQRVSLHRLVDQGAGFVTEDTDLLVADRPDFHPTDVLEDADGSLLVVDTGGWYTLCCPTSHIDQSQATGGIYRLIPETAAPEDPRGQQIDWQSLDAAALVGLLGDLRPVVRQKARLQLVEQPDAAAALVAAIQSSGESGPTALQRVHATWCLIDIIGRLAPQEAGGEASGAHDRLLSELLAVLDDPHPTVRLAAIGGLGLHRHQPAADALVQRLAQAQQRERRHLATALGRLQAPAAAEPLLSAAAAADGDRLEQHALLHALIEIGEAATEPLVAALASDDAPRRLVALRVLDQMENSPLQIEQVMAAFRGTDAERELAVEILARRPQWDSALAAALPGLLEQTPAEEDAQQWQTTLQRLVLREGLAEAVAQVIATGSDPQRTQLLEALAVSPPSQLPPVWAPPIAARLTASDVTEQELRQWTKLLAAVRWAQPPPEVLVQAAAAALKQHAADVDRWLMLAAASPPGAHWRDALADEEGNPSGFERLLALLDPDSPPHRRQLALAALGRQRLTPAERLRLAGSAGELGPMELAGVLTLLRRVHDEAINIALLKSLQGSSQPEMISASMIEDHFGEHPEPIRQLAQPVITSLAGEQGVKQQEHLRQLLEGLPSGDPLRGLQLFRSSRAACSACHAIGYHGGKIGPDLTRINRIRTPKDLLEAIIYPSISFVRSYESFLVMTDDGRAINGVIADEDLESITLVTGIDQRVRIAREEIEEIRPSAVSIMPAGLDQQLSAQELADLLAFLTSER